jgi:hypothetical protein
MRPKLIPTLLQVCHRVHAWQVHERWLDAGVATDLNVYRVEPLLYRVLLLENFSDPQVSAVEHKSPSFLHNSVRHLFFSTDTSIWELIQERLLGCPRIISLFILGPWKPEFLLVLEKLRPQKLYLSVPLSTSEWAQSTLNQSLFLSITQLELFRGDDYDNGTTWEDWAQLATLPSLTHLCLSEPLARDILSPSVIACPRLVVAIGSFGDSDQTSAREFAQGLTISDPRLVIMALLIYKEDWEISAQGGDDFWSRAEGFVARKRRGKLRVR